MLTFHTPLPTDRNPCQSGSTSHLKSQMINNFNKRSDKECPIGIHLGTHLELLCCDVGYCSLEGGWNCCMTCCSSSSDFIPDMWLNIVILVLMIQVLECPGPEFNEIGYQILPDDVHEVEWKWWREGNLKEGTQNWYALDAIFFSELLTCDIVGCHFNFACLFQ